MVNYHKDDLTVFHQPVCCWFVMYTFDYTITLILPNFHRYIRWIPAGFDHLVQQMVLNCVFKRHHRTLNIHKWEFQRIVDLIWNKPLCKACLVLEFEIKSICFDWWLNAAKLNGCLWVQMVVRIIFQAKNSYLYYENVILEWEGKKGESQLSHSLRFSNCHANEPSMRNMLSKQRSQETWNKSLFNLFWSTNSLKIFR